MRRKKHARFLGGWTRATASGYPTLELNVGRELKFSNWSCFGFLKSAQLPIMFNPVGLAMPIPGLLVKRHCRISRIKD